MKAVHFEFSLLQSRINNKINDRLFHVTRISALRGEKRGGGYRPQAIRALPRVWHVSILISLHLKHPQLT